MNRLIKLTISIFVFVANATRDAMIRLIGRTPKGKCVVLYYHSVPAVERQSFTNQMAALIRHATPIVPCGSHMLEKGVRYVVVTFDDGFEDFTTQALPVLSQFKIPSIVFVIADAIGKRFGPNGRAQQIMTLAQVLSLPTDLVTIGSHTSTHQRLPQIPKEAAQDEINGSRKKLQVLLSRDITLFSFPFGAFDHQLIEMCRDAGYQRVFTTLPELSFQDPNPFVVGRVRVDPNDWPIEFRLKLAGAYLWLPRAFAIKQKLMALATVRWMISRGYKPKRALESQSAIHEPN
jgi:peptidoglycan/xylan/chitin deacetylase (PgdA/CDA1 family)